MGSPPAPRRPVRRALAAGGAIAAAALAAALVAVQVAGEAPGPAPAVAGGLTDRVAFEAAVIGDTSSRVRRVLGGAPRAVQTSPLQLDGPECWVYARRSGRDGGYRLCFRDGVLETKARIPASG